MPPDGCVYETGAESEAQRNCLSQACQLSLPSAGVPAAVPAGGAEVDVEVEPPAAAVEPAAP